MLRVAMVGLAAVALALAGCTSAPPGLGGTPTPTGLPVASGPLVRCMGEPEERAFPTPLANAEGAAVPRWCVGDTWNWDVLDRQGNRTGEATWLVRGTEHLANVTAYVVEQREPGWANHTVRYDVANLNEVFHECGKPGGVGDCQGRVPRFDFPLREGKAWSYACCGGDVVWHQRANASYAGELPLSFSPTSKVPTWRIIETADCCGRGPTEYLHTAFAPFNEKTVRDPGGNVTERWMVRIAEAPRIPNDCERLDGNQQWWNATLDGARFRVTLPWVGEAEMWNANVTITGNASVTAVTVAGWGDGLTVTGAGHVVVRSHRAEASAPTTGCVAERYLSAKWSGAKEERPSQLGAFLHDDGPVHVVLNFEARSSWCGRNARFEGNATQPPKLELVGQDEAQCS